MNQSDLILEFIDGTLDPQREQGLFERMAGHPELRAELRQYVMIGDAVRADWEAYMPPADVEKQLLGGLGVVPPAGAASAGVAAAGGTAARGGGVAVALGLLSRLKSAIVPLMVGFVVGGLFAGGGVYLSMNSSGPVNPEETFAREQGGSSSADLSGQSMGQNGSDEGSTVRTDDLAAHSGQNTGPSGEVVGRGIVTSGARNNGQKNGDGLDVEVSGRNGNQTPSDWQNSDDPVRSRNMKQGPEESVSAQGPEGLSPEQQIMNRAAQDLYVVEPATLPVLDKDDVATSIEEERGRERAASRSGKKLPEPSPFDFRETGENSRPLTLELRKALTSGPIVDNNALEVNNGFLSDEDFVASAYYALGSGMYTGLEVGRERYAQKLFHNRDDTLFIEQRPVINWLGGTLGTHLNAFSVPFFVQAGFGVSEYGGSMGRGRIGIDVMDLLGRSSGAFSVPLSVEASSLVYRYNKQYLVTGNWGINAGAQFRFGF